MGCDITKVDEEYTVATMCKKKRDETGRSGVQAQDKSALTVPAL